MIVLGDISGIQRYLFDVAEAGGGQARRLRARSFLVQALAECAALRVREALGWPSSALLLSGAGKFILRGTGDPAVFRDLSYELNGQLLRETSGELRLSFGIGDGGPSEVEDYRQAQAALQRAKATPWRPAGAWEPGRLTLPPLGTPCVLCRRAPATETDADPDTREPRDVCRQCSQTYRIGRSLPHARLLVLRDGTGGDFSWFGVTCDLVRGGGAGVDQRTREAIAFDGRATPPPGCPPGRFGSRRLMANIPLDEHGDPVWFVDLATHATGDRLLAVLKADVDSLGVQIEQRLQGRTELTDFLRLADSLDEFFAEELRREIQRDQRWHTIYTVFAGGDDLVMIGPWDVVFRFAGRMRELFSQRFPELTLSAGVSLFKPKRPVKTAIEQAERLLDEAKQGPKDQCAALGQVWNWQQQGMILREAERLVGWVGTNQIQRGWLHTVLELALARHGTPPDALATARLAYHVARNWRHQTEARRWADELVSRFDDVSQAATEYLPAILRYALTATRSPNDRG